MKSVSLGGGLQLHSNEVAVKYKKLADDAYVPSYQSSGAAGFDFQAYISESEYAGWVVIMPGETMLISTGLAFEVPEGFEIQVRPRSGLSAKTGIRVANSPGTIDCDYRGEVKIILANTGDTPFTVNHGDRIAQGVLAPVYRAVFKEADELSETERGQGGFGSSGK